MLNRITRTPNALVALFRSVAEENTLDLDASACRLLCWKILLSAAAALYLELMMIRLHASFFQLFAYYKNITLLSAFLGLGLGFMRAGRKPQWLAFVLPALAAQIGLLYTLRLSLLGEILKNPVTEQLTMGLSIASHGHHVLTAYAFLTLVFIVNTFCFIPLGQLQSELMQRERQLASYKWNLLGSMVGIGLFSLVSFLWAPPAIWVLAGTVLLLPFVSGRVRPLLATGLSGLFLVALLGLPFSMNCYNVYSPYQVLTLIFQNQAHPRIMVNDVYFQHILDLPKPGQEANVGDQAWFNHYSLPYLIRPQPSRVLVVGAGTGNDVASGLYHGARIIDAVEIDPAIQQMGRLFHPAAPYQSPRVNSIIDDARNFIQATENKYDLIVYGLLDSHTLLSGRSSVRLDSYVYTVESLQQARLLLTENGVICLSFYVLHPQLGRKLYLMLRAAFDEYEPVVYQSNDTKRYTFVIGNGAEYRKDIRLSGIRDITSQMANPDLEADMSTDDWPFFYMPVKRYPASYVAMLSILFIVSLAFIFFSMPGGVRRGLTSMSWPAFFLGAGFMLLETKAITELALVFGSTWLVNSVVIACILVMAYLANLLVMWLRRINLALVYSLLGMAILAGMMLGMSFSSGNLVGWLRVLLMPAMLTLPLLFSGVAFSAELKSAPVSAVFSANLLGAMLGGFMEYNSMYFGFRSLYLLAMGMYVLAYLCTRFRKA